MELFNVNKHQYPLIGAVRENNGVVEILASLDKESAEQEWRALEYVCHKVNFQLPELSYFGFADTLSNIIYWSSASVKDFTSKLALTFSPAAQPGTTEIEKQMSKAINRNQAVMSQLAAEHRVNFARGQKRPDGRYYFEDWRDTSENSGRGFAIDAWRLSQYSDYVTFDGSKVSVIESKKEEFFKHYEIWLSGEEGDRFAQFVGAVDAINDYLNYRGTQSNVHNMLFDLSKVHEMKLTDNTIFAACNIARGVNTALGCTFDFSHNKEKLPLKPGKSTLLKSLL